MGTMPGRVVGITGSYEAPESGGRFTLNAAYFDAVEAAGGAPRQVPPVREEATLRSRMGKVDAALQRIDASLESQERRITADPGAGVAAVLVNEVLRRHRGRKHPE